MENPTMTHDEIKAALTPKYRTAQAVCERIHGEAWYALTEERDADRYEFLMRTMRSVTHYLEGIQGAAEALGIDKDELSEAAKAIRKDDATRTTNPVHGAWPME